MAKKNSGFSFKGLVSYEDGKFQITEIKKESEDTYDLTAELLEYIDKTISISVKEEINIKPIEE